MYVLLYVHFPAAVWADTVIFIYNEGDAFIAMEWLQSVIASYK